MYLKFYDNYQIYPTHLRSVYDPTGSILAILCREVPHVLLAKYQQNQPGDSERELVSMVSIYMYEHDGYLDCLDHDVFC